MCYLAKCITPRLCSNLQIVYITEFSFISSDVLHELIISINRFWKYFAKDSAKDFLSIWWTWCGCLLEKLHGQLEVVWCFSASWTQMCWLSSLPDGKPLNSLLVLIEGWIFWYQMHRLGGDSGRKTVFFGNFSQMADAPPTPFWEPLSWQIFLWFILHFRP